MNILSFSPAILICTVIAGVYAADGIESIAKKLGTRLSNLLDKTNYTELSKIVSGQEVQNLDEEAIKKDVVNLEKLFGNRSSMAENMEKYAVSAYVNHTIDQNLDTKHEYFDAEKTNGSYVLESHPDFPVAINLTNSAVQTPTDVYQYTTDILRSIKWTRKLDEKFKENKQDKDISAWQYIGLSNGVFRFFPGRLWPSESEHFDVRQRSWYIEGSSSPKDMVIILDLSGSVIGNRLLIIKLAVIHLLRTLQENDFVNIIYFNEKAHYLKKCWKHLVQATERNKRILEAAVSSGSVTGKNVANVDKGFKLAFEILKESLDANQTSNCTQTIAFFTDGVEGDTVAEEVFSDYNSKKKVRVFTYLVGNENGSPFEAVKWIACNNKGYFYRIKTLSDVRQNIVKYVTVLSRSRNNKPKWTPLYLDALGLGMTSSLVVPIKDKDQLIGVLGSDLRLSEILSNFPEPHLGSGGYPFLITNNGLVFYHPLLQTERIADWKHPVSIYLSELLHHFNDKDNTTEKLAKKMINRENKSPSFQKEDFKPFLVLARYNDKFRLVKRKLVYSYNKINQTLFSVGIAVTDYGSKLIKPGNHTGELDTALKILEDERKFNINIGKNWPYCSKSINNWTELKESLKNGQCNGPKRLMDLVLHDIIKLGDDYSGWVPKENSLSTVKAFFFGTTSGLTFYKSMDSKTFNTSIKQEYFQRAADSWENETIIFSVPNEDGEVIASKAVVGSKVLWGVIGVIINSTNLNNEILKHECDSGENKYCYLVDENGYIVSSTKQEKENGQFFGMVEGDVMKDLIDKNVYEKHSFTDVQAMCKVSSDDSSSSIRLLDPLFALVSYAKWWTQTLALSLVQYSLYTALTRTGQVKAEGDSKKTYHCFKKIDLYYRDPTHQENAGNDSLSLSGCEMSYNASAVNGTNLLLVTVRVDNRTYCRMKTSKMSMSEEDEYKESCDLIKQHRVFISDFGGTCTPKKKESQECSSGKLLIPSVAFFTALQMLLLLFQRE